MFRNLRLAGLLALTTIGVGALVTPAQAASPKAKGGIVSSYKPGKRQPAVVGTCHWGAGGIYYAGTTLQEYFYLDQCQNVDMIQIQYQAAGDTESAWDMSVGPTRHPASSPPTLLVVACGRQYTGFTGTCNHIVHVNPWCPPQTTRAVKFYALARVHQRTPSNWGYWNELIAGQENIWC